MLWCYIAVANVSGLVEGLCSSRKHQRSPFLFGITYGNSTLPILFWAGQCQLLDDLKQTGWLSINLSNLMAVVFILTHMYLDLLTCMWICHNLRPCFLCSVINLGWYFPLACCFLFWNHRKSTTQFCKPKVFRFVHRVSMTCGRFELVKKMRGEEGFHHRWRWCYDGCLETHCKS